MIDSDANYMSRSVSVVPLNASLEIHQNGKRTVFARVKPNGNDQFENIEIIATFLKAENRECGTEIQSKDRDGKCNTILICQEKTQRTVHYQFIVGKCLILDIGF